MMHSLSAYARELILFASIAVCTFGIVLVSFIVVIILHGANFLLDIILTTLLHTANDTTMSLAVADGVAEMLQSLPPIMIQFLAM